MQTKCWKRTRDSENQGKAFFKVFIPILLHQIWEGRKDIMSMSFNREYYKHSKEKYVRQLASEKKLHPVQFLYSLSILSGATKSSLQNKNNIQLTIPRICFQYATHHPGTFFGSSHCVVSSLNTSPLSQDSWRFSTPFKHRKNCSQFSGFAYFGWGFICPFSSLTLSPGHSNSPETTFCSVKFENNIFKWVSQSEEEEKKNHLSNLIYFQQFCIPHDWQNPAIRNWQFCCRSVDQLCISFRRDHLQCNCRKHRKCLSPDERRLHFYVGIFRWFLLVPAARYDFRISHWTVDRTGD